MSLIRMARQVRNGNLQTFKVRSVSQEGYDPFKDRLWPYFTDWMSSSFFFRDRALIANSRFNALPLVVGSS